MADPSTIYRSPDRIDLASRARQVKHRGMWRSFGCIIAFLFLSVLPNIPAASGSRDQAQITKIVRDVKLVPSGEKAKPAALDDTVKSGTGVRTGDRSRSELTFVDLTIERLGANTLFSFDSAGRHVDLESGSMLLRVPKDSGGAQMTTRAVTVGITGTTVILETGNRNRLFVLEGHARLSLNKYPRESVMVRGGQMEDVPPGATKLPAPVNVNLHDIMNNHPLITGFPPLPSQDLIYATADNPPTTGPQPGPVPGFIPPIVGNILGTAVGNGPGVVHGGRQSGRGNIKSTGSNKTTGPSTKGKGSSDVSAAGVPKTTPSPTPRRKSK